MRILAKIGRVDNKTTELPEFCLLNMIWESPPGAISDLSFRNDSTVTELFFFFPSHFLNGASKTNLLLIPLTTFSNLPFRLGQHAQHFPIIKKTTFFFSSRSLMHSGRPIIWRGSLLYLKRGRHLRRCWRVAAMKTIDATTGVRHKRQQLTSSCVEHTEDEKRKNVTQRRIYSHQREHVSHCHSRVCYIKAEMFTLHESKMAKKLITPFLLDFITVITPPPPSKSVAACQMSGWQTCLLRRLSLSKLKPGFNVTPLWAQTQ